MASALSPTSWTNHLPKSDRGASVSSMNSTTSPFENKAAALCSSIGVPSFVSICLASLTSTPLTVAFAKDLWNADGRPTSGGSPTLPKNCSHNGCSNMNSQAAELSSANRGAHALPTFAMNATSPAFLPNLWISQPARSPSSARGSGSSTLSKSTISPFENLAAALPPLTTTSLTIASSNDLRNADGGGVQFSIGPLMVSQFTRAHAGCLIVVASSAGDKVKRAECQQREQ